VNSDPKVREKLAALPRAVIKPPPDFNGRHKIQQGETLSEIAVLYNVSVAELEKANDLLSRHKIRAGNWLYVPTKSDDQGKSSKPKQLISPARLPNLLADKPEGKKAKVAITENHGPSRSSSAKP
jgi:LysM repeat protein